MSDLTPRPSGGLSRRERERRAYRLTLATGAAGVTTIALVVLGIFVDSLLPAAFVLALVTAALGFALKRTLTP